MDPAEAAGILRFLAVVPINTTYHTRFTQLDHGLQQVAATFTSQCFRAFDCGSCAPPNLAFRNS